MQSAVLRSIRDLTACIFGSHPKQGVTYGNLGRRKVKKWMHMKISLFPFSFVYNNTEMHYFNMLLLSRIGSFWNLMKMQYTQLMSTLR